MFGKKQNLNNKIYLLAMNRVLIDNRDIVDLGKYYLECRVEFADVNKCNDEFDACLALGVKLIDKYSKQAKWGNVYYKSLVPNSRSVSDISSEVVREYKNLLASSEEDKINFMNRMDDGNRLYILDEYANGFDEFFSDLEINIFGHSPLLININGKVPVNAREAIEEEYNNVFGQDYLVLKRK